MAPMRCALANAIRLTTFSELCCDEAERKDEAYQFHHIGRCEKVEIDFTFARLPFETPFLEPPKLSPHSADSSREIDDHRKLIGNISKRG